MRNNSTVCDATSRTASYNFGLNLTVNFQAIGLSTKLFLG